MLTIDTIPLFKISNFKFEISDYLFSLCNWCLRQRRQNFLNSSLFGVFFLFFVVT